MAVALTAVPTAGEAGWWPFSKRGERAVQQNQPPPVDSVQPPAPFEQPSAPFEQPLTLPPAAASDPVVAPPTPDTADRMTAAESKIRELNGKIEELEFQLRQLTEQFHAVQADNEYRLQIIEADNAPPRNSAGSTPERSAPMNAPVIADPPPLDEAAAAAPASDVTGSTTRGAPPQTLGQLVIDAPAGPTSDQPIDLASVNRDAIAAGDAAARPVPVSAGDSVADYNQSYEYILTGSYDVAEASFRDFLVAHPGDQRAADARYWLGESLFQRGLYRDAADEFLAGYKQFPKSKKAPDTLLKLGLSLAGLGEREAACSTYVEALKRYPDASNALRQRIAAEQAIARC